MQKGPREVVSGMQHSTYMFISLQGLCRTEEVRRTIGVETLAANTSWTEIEWVAGVYPCLACSDVAVEGRCKDLKVGVCLLRRSIFDGVARILTRGNC